MASLYIAEFETLPAGVNGAQIIALPPIARQKVTISGTSAQSAALNAKTRIVRIWSDTACWFETGANPTASASTDPLAANTPEYFGVQPSTKIAAITA